LGPRASGRAGGPRGEGGRAGLSSGGGLHADVEAECLELADEPAGAVLGRVAAGEPVRAELALGQTVADDVVVGDEDVVPRVSKDMERDYFMTPEEAREYGIIDRVIAHH
jgi:hypothetical protein